MASLMQELQGTQCRCQRNKKARESFCRWCYFKLPKELQRALYQRLGEGYEEAYANAVRFLGSAGGSQREPGQDE